MHERIPLALLFSMNQDLVPSADLAIEVCYLPLLEVFEAHPDVRLHLLVAGPLLDWASWEAPRLVELIRRLVARGQVELVAGTFARNIIYCSDPRVVADSIRFHRELLQHLFGVLPSGFLNPGKVWSHEYIGQLYNSGLGWTLVDERVLRASGVREKIFCARTGISGNDRLTLLTDSHALTSGINDAVRWFSVSGYEAMVQNLVELKRGSPDGIFTYCEYAEASGLWQYLDNDGDPRTVQRHWDRLLTQLERDERIQTVHVSDWIDRTRIHERLESSVDGEPEWISEVFAMPGTRWNEGGYGDWFDFAENSVEMRYFREFYGDLARRIELTAGTLVQTRLPADWRVACERCIEDARFALVLHQYELGFAEQDVRGYSRRELARTLVVRLALVDHIIGERTGFSICDVNDDGIAEIVWLDAGNFYVFSKFGGRLIYWFDVKSGREIVGGEHLSYYEELFRDDNRVPPEVGYGDGLWTSLPEGVDAACFTRRYRLRRRAFYDTLEVCTPDLLRRIVLSDHELPFSLKPERLEFLYDQDGVSVLKQLSIHEDGVGASWHVATRDSEAFDIALTVQHALSPQFEDALREGRGREMLVADECSVASSLFEIRLEHEGTAERSLVMDPFAATLVLDFKADGVGSFTAASRLRKTLRS